jgi:hypothetical protein
MGGSATLTTVPSTNTIAEPRIAAMSVNRVDAATAATLLG